MKLSELDTGKIDQSIDAKKYTHKSRLLTIENRLKKFESIMANKKEGSSKGFIKRLQAKIDMLNKEKGFILQDLNKLGTIERHIIKRNTPIVPMWKKALESGKEGLLKAKYAGKEGLKYMKGHKFKTAVAGGLVYYVAKKLRKKQTEQEEEY